MSLSLVRQDDSELLIRREKFAIHLRKQKRNNLINQNRLKYDIHPTSTPALSDQNLVDRYCVAVKQSILDENDILPSLTELRRLLSNQEFLTSYWKEFE